MLKDETLTDGDVKIGDTKHGGRNVGIGMGIIGGAALLAGYYFYQGHADAPQLTALAEFRGAYAEKCDVAEFRGAAPAYVVTEFLDHEDLRNVVAKERAALGTSTCKDIDRELRAAGYPISSPKPQ